jgi:hypothetical protein
MERAGTEELRGEIRAKLGRLEAERAYRDRLRGLRLRAVIAVALGALFFGGGLLLARSRIT